MNTPPFRRTIITKSLADMAPIRPEGDGLFSRIMVHLTPQDGYTINRLVERFAAMNREHALPWSAHQDLLLAMDLTLCHLNARPLKLERMLMSSDLEFSEDIANITRELDRKTGRLPDWVKLHGQAVAS